MKIVSKSPSEMILEQSALGSQIWGLIFAGIGVLAISISTENKLFALIIGGLFVFSGLLLTALSKSATISLNKSNALATFTFSNFIGSKKQEVPFNCIKEVALETDLAYRGAGVHKEAKYNIVIYMIDGDSILMPFGNNSSGLIVTGYRMLTGAKQKASDVCGAVADFIQVPYVYREPPSIEEAFRQITKNSIPRNHK